MKKMIKTCLAGVMAAVLLTGCADGGPSGLGTVTLGQYKGLTVNIPAPAVTDAEIDTRIETVLSQNPEQEEVDRAAAEGDVVNIDFKGTQDGVEFAGGSAEGQDLELGSGMMIDGFEEGLVGLKKGETKNLDLTFPEDYYEASLAGQAVVFEVTVNAVKEVKDAVLNDEFVQSVSEYQTVDEYKEGLRAEMLADKQKNTDQAIQQAVLSQVIDGSEFKLSRNGLSKSYNTRIDQYKEQAAMYNMSLSQFAQANGMDEPALKESVYAMVEDDARNQLVLEAVAAQEGIAVTEEDKTAFAEENGQTFESIVELYGQEDADQIVLNYKVMKFLGDNAVNEGLQTEETSAESEAAEGETAAESEAAEGETAAQESEAAPAETTAE